MAGKKARNTTRRRLARELGLTGFWSDMPVRADFASLSCCLFGDHGTVRIPQKPAPYLNAYLLWDQTYRFYLARRRRGR